MDDKRTPTKNQSEQYAVEQIWLNYFNQTLYEKGLISETERNRMKNMICSRRPSAHKR